jgi:cell division septation protein DedD
LASHAQDDGFHEIQLSGKQLVFLFMAATVVSVVIFLCGVLVGRNVRAERAMAVADAATAATEPPLPAPSAPAATPAGSDPTAAAPPPAVDDLSYFNRLEKSKPPKEELKPTPEKAAPEKPAPEKAAPEKAAPAKPAPQKAMTEPPPPAPAEKAQPPSRPAPTAAPAGDGEFTVQIAALNARSEADSIARRLSSKGYPAYVVPPGNGAVMYRVRVGRFKTRHDAEPIAARLQKEEQFKPWITR